MTVDHDDTGGRSGQILPDGMSPLEMLLAEEAEARAARPLPSSGRQPRPSRQRPPKAPRQSTPKAPRQKQGGSKLLAGVAGVVVVAVAIAGTLLYLDRRDGTDLASPSASSQEEPAPGTEADSAEPAAEPEASTDAPPPANAAPSVEADRAVAARMVLTPADLPGFTVAPDEETSGAGDLDVDACINQSKVVAGDVWDARGVDAPSFERGTELMVSSAVVLAESEPQAVAGFDAMSAPGVGACLGEFMTNELRRTVGQETGVTITGTQSSAALSQIGDEIIGHRSAITAVGPGGKRTVYFDIVIIREGRALALFSFVGTEKPWPVDEIERLGETVIGRMAT